MSSFDGPYAYPPNVAPCMERCGRCRACRAAQRYANRQLADELGIPLGAPIRRVVFNNDRTIHAQALVPFRPQTFPPQSRHTWDGYSVEIFGVLLYEEPPADVSWSVARLPWLLQLWQVIVRYGDSPIYGRVRWSPDDGERVSIHGLEANYYVKHVEVIRQRLRLWREVTTRGPKLGSGVTISTEDVREQMRLWIDTHNGKPPTQIDEGFSRLFGLGPRDLQRKLSELKEDNWWNKTKRELVSIYVDDNEQQDH